MPKPSGSSRFTINGTRGADFLDGSIYLDPIQAGGLIVKGNAGNDTIKGGFGRDFLDGGDGDDLIYGQEDDLAGTADGTLAWDGGRGNDTLDLSSFVSDPGTGVYVEMGFGPNYRNSLSTDTDRVGTGPFNWGLVYGTTYRDNFRNFENVVLGAGDDTVIFGGTTGSNIVYGGAGSDWIDTSNGNDTIFGQDGDDIIIGGWGNDTASGGAGRDLFAFVGRLASEYTRDIITDFETANDEIWLFAGWSISWDASSQSVLHGYFVDQGTIFGEITISNLAYANAGSVSIHNFD